MGYYKASLPILLMGLLVGTVSAASDPGRKLDAALLDSGGEYLYLFSGGTLIQVSLKYKAEGRLVNSSSLWPGLNANVDAAVNWTGDGHIYFFLGNTFYTFSQDGLSQLEDIESGWPDQFRRAGVDAAANRNGKSIFFSGCSYWNPYEQVIDGALTTSNLLALNLPCDIDAAWEDGPDILLAKGDNLWRWGQNVTGPFPLDSYLDICSKDHGVNTSVLLATLPSPLVCNGDTRLCRLPVDQVTLPGSHNAGSGFAGPFRSNPCLYQNHDLSVLQQLRFGIRYLDVDACWDECGKNLGTCHASTCAGLLCSMLVQIKLFLIENPTEVVMVNFNHDMTQDDIIIPELVRQIEEQLLPFLNSDFRETGQWPTLEKAVTSGKRLFVIIATQVTRMSFYSSKTWIIDEVHMASTYQMLVILNNCASVVNNTRSKCSQLASKTLIEVSVFGGFGDCIDDMMTYCDDYLFKSLQACSEARINANKAPNVLMVDYPAFTPPHHNVVSAVRQQNVRNLLAFGDKCRMRIDAATSIDRERDPFFFSGHRTVAFSHSYKAQTGSDVITSLSPDLPYDIDSAISGRYWGKYDATFFLKGCYYWVLQNGSVTGPVAINDTFPGLECNIDAAVGIHSTAYFFKGCDYWTYKRFWNIDGPHQIQSRFRNLPCNISAALSFEETVYFFQNTDNGTKFWELSNGNLKPATDLLEWELDVVVCDD